MSEFDVSVKGGKTQDGRKSCPKPVVNDTYELPPGLDDVRVGKSDSKLQDARKMCAKPAGTSDWECTMI